MKYVSGFLAILFLMVICLGAGAVLGPRVAPQLAGLMTDAQAGPVKMAENAPSTISVSGSGSVKVKPDTAVLSLGVTQSAQGAVAAQSSVNQKIAAVKKALTDQGIAAEDISVSDLYVYARYDYKDEIETLVGYNASHQLEVRVRNLDEVGAVIDAALAAGANRMDGVRFLVEDQKTAYDQAMKLALEDARAKAQVLAQAEGMSLGQMTSMSEAGGYAERGAVEYAVQDAAAGASTQVDAGTVTVSAGVNACFASLPGNAA